VGPLFPKSRSRSRHTPQSPPSRPGPSSSQSWHSGRANVIAGGHLCWPCRDFLRKSPLFENSRWGLCSRSRERRGTQPAEGEKEPRFCGAQVMSCKTSRWRAFLRNRLPARNRAPAARPIAPLGRPPSPGDVAACERVYGLEPLLKASVQPVPGLTAQSDENEHGAATECENQCDGEIIEHVAVRRVGSIL
jgi:hypothetical protein